MLCSTWVVTKLRHTCSPSLMAQGRYIGVIYHQHLCHTVIDHHHSLNLQAMCLLKLCLLKELRDTTSEGTLFRGSSLSTRLVSHFMRSHGSSYLEATLAHFFAKIRLGDVRVEVDPNRAPDFSPADIDRNCIVHDHLVAFHTMFAIH